MICALLQDLHLVQSIDCTSELPRRYHSVRMDILTPYGKVFPTRTVGNGSTYRRKSGSLAFSFSLSPSSFFAFASLRLLRPRAREVSGKQRRKRSVIFGKRKRKRKGRRRKKKEEFGGTDVKTAWEGDLFFQF